MVVYHGTTSGHDFRYFDEKKLGKFTEHPTSKLGFFFTPSPKIADSFTRHMYLGEKHMTNARIVPVFVSIKNPAKISLAEFDRFVLTKPVDAQKKKVDEMIQLAKDRGHDGIIIKGNPDYVKNFMADEWNLDPQDLNEWASDQIIAFKSKQIKSVYNRGTWDKRFKDILYGVAAGSALKGSVMEDYEE